MTKINTGDVLVVSTNNRWISKQIQKVTDSQWNHTGLFIWIWGELYVIEAEYRGIQLTKWDDPKYQSGTSKKRQCILLKPKNIIIDEKTLAKFVLPMAGTKPYDYMSFIYQLIYNYTGEWIGRTKEKASNRFYCSEFVAYTYNKLFDYFPYSWWNTSPKMVVREDYFDVYNINYAKQLIPTTWEHINKR